MYYIRFNVKYHLIENELLKLLTVSRICNHITSARILAFCAELAQINANSLIML